MRPFRNDFGPVAAIVSFCCDLQPLSVSRVLCPSDSCPRTSVFAGTFAFCTRQECQTAVEAKCALRGSFTQEAS
jgi:hypothetical protein